MPLRQDAQHRGEDMRQELPAQPARRLQRMSGSRRCAAPCARICRQTSLWSRPRRRACTCEARHPPKITTWSPRCCGGSVVWRRVMHHDGHVEGGPATKSKDTEATEEGLTGRLSDECQVAWVTWRAWMANATPPNFAECCLYPKSTKF